MEIILLEKVHNLGELGEVVQVANGYARNFLLPQQKAMRCTQEAKIKVEERRQRLVQQESKRREVAQARADSSVREISVTRLAGENGKLYGSVSSADIAEALQQVGCKIEKSEILQPEGAFKQLGEFSVEVMLHAEVRFTLKVMVLEEQGKPPPEQLADA